MKPKHVSFDMDDTLVATHAYIAEHLKPSTPEIAATMRDCDEKGLAYIYAGKELQDDIWEQILRLEEFMVESGMASWLERHYTEFVELLTRLTNLGHTFSICTHRGWTDTAHALTKHWLLLKDLNFFETIHCLNSEEYPCKLAYLKEHYGDDFVLVDDNPFHGEDRVKELQHNRQVLQCVGEHTVDTYVHFTKFSTFDEFKTHLLDFLGVNDEHL